MKYLSVLLLISISSCNPVKQVLNNKERLNQVAEEVIRLGYCINDTTVITELKDTVIFRDSVLVLVDSVPCKDFDTIIGNSRISVSSGVLSFYTKDSIVYRTKTISNSIRDKSLEAILQKDIKKLDSIVSVKDSRVRDLQIDTKDLKREVNWWRIKFGILIMASLIIIFRKQILKLVGGLI